MNRALVVCFISVGLLLQGCYGAKVFRQPVTVDDTARDLEALRQVQGNLEQRLQALERRIADQTDLLRQMRADESLRWEELESRLLAIDSRFRDGASDRRRYADIPIWSADAPRTGTRPSDRSASGETEHGHPVDAPSDEEMVDDAVGDRSPRELDEGVHGERMDPDFSPGAPGDQDPEAPGPPARDPEARRLYDQAYLDLTRGNYSLAILGFREFLRISPGSDLADNAQYWIGECYYAQRDFNQAIREFLTVEERYPHGDKVPAALLKAAYSFQALEDRAAARRYLNEVLTRFPDSDEAVLARNRLRTIG